MEDKKAVLEEMLANYTKFSSCLSRAERTTAQAEHRNLQERWRCLDRALEKASYQTSIYSQETSSLLSSLSGLQTHLEAIDKDLESQSAPVTQWNCRKAQELMVANAEVKAAQQKYIHLQQLSEKLHLSSHWVAVVKEIQLGLQLVGDKLSHTKELLCTQAQVSSNPIMEKIVKVMTDGLAWAKQTESDIEGRARRISLLPEDVHRQLRDLKKLQSEVMAKQGQLESLVEEVTELLPELDQTEEVPMVRSVLQSLEELSSSTAGELAKVVGDFECGLQTREKLSEQMADVESWVVNHLHREASRGGDAGFRSHEEFDRRARQIQETLSEAEKQAAVCEALLKKSRDISPELTIAENCQLHSKILDLQEDIQAISTYEKANRMDLDCLTQAVDSSKKNMMEVENSLRQMLVDLSRYRYPITEESLQTLEPLKQLILEHKSQLDLLQRWIPQENTQLYSLISELHGQMATLEMKSKDHERYLNLRQCAEDLRENAQELLPRTKEDGVDLMEKYKLCQTLVIQLPLIKWLSGETRSKLHLISGDLYPSQLSSEQRRLDINEENLDRLESTVESHLTSIEGNVLKDLDFDSECDATQGFLMRTQRSLQKQTLLDPCEESMKNEYRRLLFVKKTIEMRMRLVDIVRQNKGNVEEGKFQNVVDLKNKVLSQCDSQMVGCLIFLFHSFYEYFQIRGKRADVKCQGQCIKCLMSSSDQRLPGHGVFEKLHWPGHTGSPVPEGRRGGHAASARLSRTLFQETAGDPAGFGLAAAPLPNSRGADSEAGGAASLPLSPKGAAAPGAHSEPAASEDVDAAGQGTHAAGHPQQVRLT